MTSWSESFYWYIISWKYVMLWWNKLYSAYLQPDWKRCVCYFVWHFLMIVRFYIWRYTCTIIKTNNISAYKMFLWLKMFLCLLTFQLLFLNLNSHISFLPSCNTITVLAETKCGASVWGWQILWTGEVVITVCTRSNSLNCNKWKWTQVQSRTHLFT